MVLLFFWPLPPAVFAFIVSTVFCAALGIYIFFPQYSAQLISFMCTLYSVSTALFVIYALLWEKQEVWKPSLGIAFGELIVLVAVWWVLYSRVSKRLEKERE